jgi:hypothetical protein
LRMGLNYTDNWYPFVMTVGRKSYKCCE